MMYMPGEMRTDHKDRLWCKHEGKDEWFIVKDQNGNDHFNTVVKKFEEGEPNQIKQFYSARPPQPIGSTQIAGIQKSLDDIVERLQRVEELTLKFGRSK